MGFCRQMVGASVISACIVCIGASNWYLAALGVLGGGCFFSRYLRFEAQQYQCVFQTALVSLTKEQN